MEKRFQVLVTFVILIALVTSLYVFTDWFSKVTGYFTGDSEKAKLAECLQEKNTEFYDSLMCPDCEKQKAEFGDAIEKIKIIDCGREGEKCPNIKSTPAWYINKEIYYGFQNITQLDTLSECNLLS